MTFRPDPKFDVAVLYRFSFVFKIYPGNKFRLLELLLIISAYVRCSLLQWFSKSSVVRILSSAIVKHADSWDPISRGADWVGVSNLHFMSYQAILKQPSKTAL